MRHSTKTAHPDLVQHHVTKLTAHSEMCMASARMLTFGMVPMYVG